MGKIGLRPGTWTNFAAFLLSGAGAVTGATAEQEAYQVLGWIGMALGLLVLLWGITWDGVPWWRALKGKTEIPKEDEGAPPPSDTTIVGSAPESLARGSRNTYFNLVDENGNVLLNKGGISIGAGAGYDPTSVIIGAGAAASLNIKAQCEADERKRRRKLIDRCRNLVATYGGDIGLLKQKRAMEGCAEFLALRRFLSEDFDRAYARKAGAIIDIERVDRPYLMDKLTNELDRLEAEWEI